MSLRVRALVPLVTPLLMLGLAAACGGEAGVSGSASPSAPAASSGAGAATTTATTTATTPAADVVEIKVTITGGKVTPSPSVHKIAKGRAVRIIVTSDEDDELHVHGFDKSAELTAGRPVTVEFTADQVGRFEAETHESGLQLFQLQVS